MAENDSTIITETLPPVVPQVVLLDGDIKEIETLLKERNQVKVELDVVSGEIFRATKRQDVLFSVEVAKEKEIATKKDELVKRYSIDNTREWYVDVQTKQVVYK